MQYSKKKGMLTLRVYKSKLETVFAWPDICAQIRQAVRQDLARQKHGDAVPDVTE